MIVLPWRISGGLRIREPLLLLAVSLSQHAWSQPATFAGDAQHTGLSSVPAQALNAIRWSTVIDPFSSGANSHYGGPVITASNTVIVSVRTSTSVQLSAFEGATGRLKYTVPTDYLRPSVAWSAVYQPVIAPGPSGTRLYYAGPGGTLYFIENIDSDTPSTPVQQCFYADLATYNANSTNYNRAIFIVTPLT